MGGGLRQLVAEKDWSATPLGPKEGWSEALRTTVETCLGSRFPVIIFWGPELVQVYNDAYAPIIGAKHPQALGQTAAACFPEVWDVIGPMLHGVLESGEATWSDDLLLMLERNGFAEECYFTFSYSPAGGAPVEGVFCAVIETTRRVVGERRFDALRELSAALTGAHHVAEVLDATTATLARHPSDLPAGLLVRQTTGGARDERRWPGAGAGAGPAGPALARSAAEVARTGEPVVAAHDGQDYRPGRPAVAAYPVGRAATVLAVDLSTHVSLDDGYDDFLTLIAAAIGAAIAAAESYEETEQRAAALEELDRAKTSFLGNVSHEFRTPLTLLLGPLHDVAGDHRLPAEARDKLALAERNARRLLHLVNGLLDIARLEAGRASADFEPTDLAELTAGVASIFRSAAEAAGLAWVVDCAPLPGPVAVDRDMWEQVVTNLCANAVKFTPAGAVTVRLRADGDRARLEVTDTGIGIPAAEIPFVFDRFRRSRAAAVRAVEGTGIGLALVRELVALHGGELGVESRPGAGSTFWVLLPLGAGHPATGATPAPPGASPAARDAVAALEALRPGEDPAPVATGGRDPAAGSVYVVDDNADMRSYLRDLLGRSWSVTTFADPRVALAAIEARPPDLVLTDVMLPAMDGFALLSVLRSRPDTAQLPVILLSARAGEEAVVGGLEAGADDYLIKPFAARTLLARVRSHLDLAALRRESGARVARHNAQLTALAAAAGDIVAAETIEEIVEVVEGSARRVTGAATCRLQLDPRPPDAEVPFDGGPPPLVVPLPAAGGGTVARLLLTPGGAEVGDGDRRLLDELARIAGRRIERLREYQREHHLADTLQRSLLPQVLPAVRGVELAARYRPAQEAAAVGGDWYDALVLPDGRLLVMVGDVIGHDLNAAVAMGQLRHLLRAHALDAPDPARLCETVNRLLPALGTGEMATVAVAHLDLDRGRVTITSAGHPPPVVVGAGGTASLLAVPACPPLGALDATPYESVQATLDPGATLVLYTDGLVERRGEPIDASLRRFATRCGALGDPSLDAALDGLLDDVLAPGTAADDVAVLAVRRTATGAAPPGA